MPAIRRSLVTRFALFIGLVFLIINVATIHRKLARETPLLQDFTSPQSWSDNDGGKIVSSSQSKKNNETNKSNSSNDSKHKNETTSQNNAVDDVAKESFSACLLFMDDNHRLPEWLAFHYYALPLRHLIIAVDPASTQNPPHIPSRWKELIDITVWNDADHIPSYMNLTRDPADAPEESLRKHRYRQSNFYIECSKHLIKSKRNWTSYHDIDEFLTITEDFFSHDNPRPALSSPEVRDKATLSSFLNYTSFTSQPGYVLKLIQEYSREPTNTSPIHEDLSQVCIHIPRTKYSAVESPRNLTQQNVPFEIDSNHFETLRFRYRATKKFDRDGFAKAIIDLSKVTNSDFRFGGVTHRPIKEVCPQKPTFRFYGAIPFGIHHYLGSLESYMYRDNANPDKIPSTWRSSSNKKDGGADDEIRPWIQGFYDSMGASLASELLQRAGVLIKDTKQV